MRATRVSLVLLGTAAAGYGLLLSLPLLPTMALWLLAGPALHDLLVAPLLAAVGLALGRLLPDRRWRNWVGGGLAGTGTLLLVAVPMLFRPGPASASPVLRDRDYRTGLLVWLAVLWGAVLLGAVLIRVSRRRSGRRPGGGAGSATR